MPAISLTTDFQHHDWFVGVMKGVIQSINPEARVVDLSHTVAPGDIRAGAFVLKSGFSYFPKGTIHVAVVDPGVGSDRAALAIRTCDYVFVGPDNGVLSWACSMDEMVSIHRIENREYLLNQTSQTFHGRDIFAPIAGHLSIGGDVSKLGPLVNDYHRLPWPVPELTADTISGEIVYIDGFGNAITSIPGSMVRAKPPASVAIRLREEGEFQIPWVSCYQDVEAGRSLLIAGSCDLLEIVVNGASAAEQLQIVVGDRVKVGRES